MAGNAGISSAFPPPPEVYKLFTDEALTLHAQNSDQLLEQTRRAFEPPELPTESYTVFGETWFLEEKLQTLKEAGVQQLYPDSFEEGISNPVPELRKLNRSLLVTFLDISKSMASDPESFPSGLEHMRVLLLNMHHLINTFRPHQARETLALMMEQQIQRREKEISKIEATAVKTRSLLDNFAQGAKAEMANSADVKVAESLNEQAQRSASLWKAISTLEAN